MSLQIHCPTNTIRTIAFTSGSSATAGLEAFIGMEKRSGEDEGLQIASAQADMRFFTGTSNSIIGVGNISSTFVAVGNSGTILTSTDGISWTSRISGTSYNLNGITPENNNL